MLGRDGTSNLGGGSCVRRGEGATPVRPSPNGTPMRRHVVLPVLLASTLGLAACGQAVDTASGDGATSPTAEAPDTSTAAPSATATAEPAATEPAATEPSAPATATEGDCSASGMTATEVTGTDLPDPTRDTAAFLLDAALRCDEQLLVTAATESGTRLTFGDAEPGAFFALPEGEEDLYATIVTLLSELTPATAEHTDPVVHVWPRVASEAFADDDAAWQEAVDAGLVTAEQAEQMRAGGSGYLGWRLGITATGDWAFLVAGD